MLPLSVAVSPFLVLQHVVTEGIGKSVIAASISQWRREDMEREMQDEEQQRIVETFRQNVTAVLAQRGQREKKSRKRKAIATEQDAAATVWNATPFSASSPSLLPSLLDDCAHHLSLHPSMLCTIDVPFVYHPPIWNPLDAHHSEESTTTGTAGSPLPTHTGLDAVASAAALPSFASSSSSEEDTQQQMEQIVTRRSPKKPDKADAEASSRKVFEDDTKAKKHAPSC